MCCLGGILFCMVKDFKFTYEICDDSKSDIVSWSGTYVESCGSATNEESSPSSSSSSSSSSTAKRGLLAGRDLMGVEVRASQVVSVAAAHGV